MISELLREKVHTSPLTLIPLDSSSLRRQFPVACRRIDCIPQLQLPFGLCKNGCVEPAVAAMAKLYKQTINVLDPRGGDADRCRRDRCFRTMTVENC